MIKLVRSIAHWVKSDWHSNPVRCTLEIIGWLISVSCSLIMMLTVPNPPFLLLYPMFITQCAIFMWSSWTRRSLGLSANYALLLTIDGIALWRLLVV